MHGFSSPWASPAPLPPPPFPTGNNDICIIMYLYIQTTHTPASDLSLPLALKMVSQLHQLSRSGQLRQYANVNIRTFITWLIVKKSSWTIGFIIREINKRSLFNRSVQLLFAICFCIPSYVHQQLHSFDCKNFVHDSSLVFFTHLCIFHGAGFLFWGGPTCTLKFHPLVPPPPFPPLIFPHRI